jgi:hypothetical protein
MNKMYQSALNIQNYFIYLIMGHAAGDAVG